MVGFATKTDFASLAKPRGGPARFCRYVAFTSRADLGQSKSLKCGKCITKNAPADLRQYNTVASEENLSTGSSDKPSPRYAKT